LTTSLVPVSDLEKMANAVAASKLFGITTPEQAMALMLVAQAEGLHPATAARDYHIIQGRPTLKADAMLARYLASGGKVEWGVHTDTEVEARFTHPQGGTLAIKWDMARAKTAELKSAMWTKYPRQMLRARVISEGVRATNPAVAVGIYTPEEAADFEPAGPKGRGAKAKPAGDVVIVPETGEVISREAELGALCKEANFSVKFYLNRAGVLTVDELTPEDYIAAVENAKQRVAKAKQPAAA
jgi:hypothetical protein